MFEIIQWYKITILKIKYKTRCTEIHFENPEIAQEVLQAMEKVYYMGFMDKADEIKTALMISNV